jgi:hypothetical protein
MKNNLSRFKCVPPIALTLTCIFALTEASYGQVLVTPNNMGIWSFGTADSGGTPGGNSGDVAQMVAGPANPLLGTGSAELATAPGYGDEASFISTNAYNGTPLADLTRLLYSTYDTANNGSQFPYIQLSVSTTGGSTADDILFFEPPYQTPASGNPNLPNQGAPAMDTWQIWDAGVGGWWSDDGNAGLTPGSGVGSLASFEAEFPSATIEANPFAGGGIELTVGYGAASDNFTGYVDDVTVGTTTGTTTFDFEAAPEPSTYSMLLASVLVLLAVIRRSRSECRTARQLSS